MIEHRPRVCLPAKSQIVLRLFGCSQPLVGPIFEFLLYRTLIMPRLASLLVLAATLMLGSAAIGSAFANQEATKGKPASDTDKSAAAQADDDDAAETATEEKSAKLTDEKLEKPAAEPPQFDPRGTRPAAGSGRDPRRGSIGKADDAKSVVA